MKVLIVDDDIRIRQELMDLLTTEGYEAKSLDDFQNVIEEIERIMPDAIILDLGLPNNSGFSILRLLRKKYNIPVIILTSQDGESEEILSLNMGADDFIGKPFNPEILVGRLNSIFRRIKKSEEVMDFKGLFVNFTSGKVGKGDKEVELSRNEIKILRLLLKNKGRIVSRDSLIEELWNYSEFIDDNTLTVNVTRIKKKLEDLGERDLIRTRKGLGYIIYEG